MEEYTVKTAKIFHGVRLDNCHSTPIHVAQYFLDKAREVRPNLYIIAELFTNSESIDNKFITELGISSLIREAMSAYNSNDLGRLVHRFGGDPAGSFTQPSHKPLLEGISNAIMYDVTHDNPSLIKSHSIYDILPTSCLVLMSGCSVASTRGFDELVPHAIDVVSEERPYSLWSTDSKPNAININYGILKAKQTMNKLHSDMGLQGYSQIYVDQFDAETTVVTRHNPNTHNNIILIARTAFSHPSAHTHNNLHKPLAIPSKIESVFLAANMSEKDSKKVEVKENISINKCVFVY
jgi:glycogen debranching enzyme